MKFLIFWELTDSYVNWIILMVFSFALSCFIQYKLREANK